MNCTSRTCTSKQESLILCLDTFCTLYRYMVGCICDTVVL